MWTSRPVRAFTRPLTLSLLAHAILLVLALLQFGRPIPQPLIRPPKPSTWEVIAGATSGEKTGVRAGSERRSPLPLKRLAPAFPGVPVACAGTNKPTEAEEGPPRREGSLGDTIDTKHVSLYRRAYALIDRYLVYPGELRAAGFHGTVQASVYLDREGRFVFERSRFATPDSYLRVAVVRALRRAFADGLGEGIKIPPAGLSLECSFSFLLSENGDPEYHKKDTFVVGNQLSFVRFFHQSKLEWQVGPLGGLGIFAVGLNPLWFFEKGADLLSKKAKFDPLQKYRDDPAW